MPSHLTTKCQAYFTGQWAFKHNPLPPGLASITANANANGSTQWLQALRDSKYTSVQEKSLLDQAVVAAVVAKEGRNKEERYDKDSMDTLRELVQRVGRSMYARCLKQKEVEGGRVEAAGVDRKVPVEEDIHGQREVLKNTSKEAEQHSKTIGLLNSSDEVPAGVVKQSETPVPDIGEAESDWSDVGDAVQEDDFIMISDDDTDSFGLFDDSDTCEQPGKHKKPETPETPEKPLERGIGETVRSLGTLLRYGPE